MRSLDFQAIAVVSKGVHTDELLTDQEDEEAT